MTQWQPSTSLVRGLWEHMGRHYGTVIRDKARSPTMHLASAIVAPLGLLPQREFMERYTTVLRHRIYVPRAPGTDAAKAWSDLAVCVHEHQHVAQWKKEGFSRFAWRYVTSPRARALYEAEAYGCDIEMAKWARRTPRDPVRIAAGLRAYGCGPSEIAEAERRLSRRARSDGGPTLEACQVAIAWLDAQPKGPNRGPSIH